MTKERTIQPQVKLIWPFLAWNFGLSWGCWLIAIVLKNIWPENPPMPSLTLEGLLTSLGMFGPAFASVMVLKKRGFKAIWSFIFSVNKGAWLYLLIFVGTLTATYTLAAGGRLVDGALLTFLGSFLYLTTMAGGMEEPGWRGFLQPALEQKFSFPVATAMTGITWAVWHLPLWFYDRFGDRSQHPFLIFTIFCILISFWYAALYKKTKSVLVCNIFHALYDIFLLIFVGLSQAEIALDFSQSNPVFHLGGYILLTGYSIYLWYRTDREEKLEND